MRCEACGEELTECDVCGGKICTPGCPDRVGDGCTCEEDEDDDEL